MRTRVFGLVGVWCAAMAVVASHPRLQASQQSAPARPAAVQPAALVKQVLRDLSQPAAQDREPGARMDRS